MQACRTFAILVIIGSISTTASAGENWPAFRGPTGDGVSDSKGLPTEWAEDKNIVWKTAIHDKGWSSPVIWGKQVWMTTALAKGQEYYGVCVDRDSGKILHDLKLFTVEKPAFCIEFNSYASSTPVIEEGRVYLHFGSVGTVCVDTTNGKELWTRSDLKCDHWRGPGSSPILFGNLLILTFDGYDVQYLAALDKNTGKTVWRKDREIAFPSTNGDLRKAYSTPSVIEVQGKPQLISPAAEATIAYEPATGQEIWRMTHGGMNEACRPIYADGQLYLTSGHTAKMFAVRPDVKGVLDKSAIVWSSNKGVPSRPSLLLSDSMLFMVNDGGMASCTDAKTGKQLVQVRLPGNYSASPILSEGHLYFCNQEGATSVVAANQEMKILATNKLAEGCMASPAVSGQDLFVRTKTHLYRISKK